MMDSCIIGEINQRVGVDDTLRVLGDFVYGMKNRIGYAAEMLERINCKDVHLILGNHDDARCGILFRSVATRAIVNLRGVELCLDHYPGLVWYKNHRGCIQLYGHSHGDAEDWADKNMPGRQTVDGCWR